MAESLLITGGRIHSCDGKGAVFEAALVRDGRIAALGSAGDLKSSLDRKTRVFDVKGATVLPGLVDTHPHALHWAALRLACVDLSDARNHEDILARIRARAAATPPGEWIMCTPVGEAHYYIRRSYHDLEEGRLPDRRILDQATDQHPVMIQAWAPRIPNIVAFNSMALKRLGLSEITPPRVCDIWIDRALDGSLSGIVRGSVTNYYTRDPFWLQILSKLPKPPEAIWTIAALAGMQCMNRMGVTTIFESHAITPLQLDSYRTARREGKASCRVLGGLEVADQAFDTRIPNDRELIDLLSSVRAMTDLSDDLFRVEGVTLCRTGPCFPGFLRMYEPIKSPYGELIWGQPFMPRRVEETVVKYCADHDIRLSALLATPVDFDEFFETVDKLGVADKVRTAAWIVQHAIFVNRTSAQRMARLGMVCTTCKGFHWGKGDMYRERVGEHVLGDLIPLRRLIDHGIKVGGGTDWGPASIFEQIQLAESCEFAVSGERNTRESQPVTRAEAIGMFTHDAAAVLGWKGVGSIAPGGYGDFVVLDRDPFEVPLHELPATTVLTTILGGQQVYGTGALAALD